MRGFLSFLDWLPTLLASTMVFLKLLALATVWSGSPIAGPLLVFTLADVIPFELARAAQRLFFDTRGIGSSFGQLVFSTVLMLALTAVQWYAVGAIVRRWLFSRASTAAPVRFR